MTVISLMGCGHCYFCQHELWSLCDNSNPNPELLDALYGHAGAVAFGYSHAFGGYAGSHAQYIRVPFANHGMFKVPDEVTDEQAVFISDAVPPGFMAADMCGIEPGDVVAVWGCGGVGQMAIRSAYLLGAERVIAIDKYPERLRLARERGGAEVLNYEETDVFETLTAMTAGRGPDRCIDAVGMEADGEGFDFFYDRTKQALRLETDRPQVLRQMIRACRKGGTLSIVGVYGGVVDKFPIGAAMNKGLTMRMSQQHGQRYVERLFRYVIQGNLDPSYILTHKLSLEDRPNGYEMFKKKTDGCVRVVFAPN